MEHSGELPQETDSITPLWVPKDQIPYDRMFPADRIWIPKILEGHHLGMDIIHDAYGQVVEVLEW